MDTSKLYLADFPAEHKIKDVDIVSLFQKRQFAELNSIVVCKDTYGNVTATFGQNNWYLMPFARSKEKHSFNFEEFNNHPELQRELKLIAYGWLFNKSPQGRRALSFTSVESQLKCMKRTYRFLVKNNLKSLKELANSRYYIKFESYLQSKCLAENTTTYTFVSINAAIRLGPWHKLNLGLTIFESHILSRKLCGKEKQQLLVIPERLCNKIYGKAIELVNDAIPHKQLIVEIENDLQNNYLEGKRILDEKIKQGHTYTLMEEMGKVNNHKYALAIMDNQPYEAKDIIAPLANIFQTIPLTTITEFKRYIGQLISSCYIICGGFSGMRDSELDKLTPNSYYIDIFEGREYHMLQSHTFKLGEKRETWVTASASKKAIELMTTLTNKWRQEVTYPDEKYKNSLWINQTWRSQPPKLIKDWPQRLSRFCRQFDIIVSKADYQECVESNPRSLERIKATVIVGQPWQMSSHQFRRTLAFYCVKNRLGTLVALKQQFKHLYLAMTEWYSNGGKLASFHNLVIDNQIQQAIDEVNAETTTNKIFSQWHSNERLSGKHGKAIMKMRSDIPHIYSSWDIIYKAVKEERLTLHGSAHSYCKSGYDCDMDGVIIPQFCVDCDSGSSIIDEQQAKWWQKKHRSLVAYMQSGEEISVSERSHYITQVRAAENVMTDFNMPFTPFEPDLKVVT
ncbi:hypothetical protein KO527_11555 [Pseudoalteromonas sp. C2R02]|uniref:hypothetical protein n=1 Tax=Pseudoalteromonas sp. C2R02 TaxID=2841565 RepID=UPI001C0A1B43|nr:hypothetical protein [Pseudoalteromonas sp. C2R02]MBU2969986.1 hypothetical protein [Pseudoalteromonas sp. C2R02]